MGFYANSLMESELVKSSHSCIYTLSQHLIKLGGLGLKLTAYIYIDSTHAFGHDSSVTNSVNTIADL